MNVMVIPEDFRKDQYILKPIITAMMESLGKGTTRVEVCRDPLLGGIDQALRWDRIQDIIEQYAWKVKLFLVCVDRDGQPGRRVALDHLERQAAVILPAGSSLFGENAWQEVEVWVLAGHDLLAGWAWQDVRAEINAKEIYFRPYAQQRGLLDGPGEGRKTLADEAVRRYSRIRQLCPEDIGALEQRVRKWLAER